MAVPVRMLNIIDEYTRECLCIKVARKITAQNVLEELFDLIVEKGVPDHIRSDNGPEFTATAVREWLGRIRVKTLFIEPGSPWALCANIPETSTPQSITVEGGEDLDHGSTHHSVRFRECGSP